MPFTRRQFIETGLLAAAAPLLPASERKEPPVHHYDFSWDRRAHIRLSSRHMPRSQSLYFDMNPWTPPAANQEGTVSYYDAERVRAVRSRLAGLDRNAYWQDILAHILKDARTDKERVTSICKFVGEAI